MLALTALLGGGHAAGLLAIVGVPISTPQAIYVYCTIFFNKKQVYGSRFYKLDGLRRK